MNPMRVLTAIRDELRVISKRLDLLTERQDRFMGKIDDLRDAMNEATTAIAARIERILQGQDDAVSAEFQPVLDNLRAMGQDPDNPVPPVDPGTPADPSSGDSPTTGDSRRW